MRSAFLRMFNDTLITIRGSDITVSGKHARLRNTIEKSLAAFLPADGWVTIKGKRVAAHGAVKKYEQSIRNILNIDLRL